MKKKKLKKLVNRLIKKELAKPETLELIVAKVSFDKKLKELSSSIERLRKDNY